jgi:hypothetical protein
MKILILDTMYPKFLKAAGFSTTPNSFSTYSEALSVLMKSRFGVSDSYSVFLGQLGHEVSEVIANSYLLQTLWSRDHLSQPIRAWAGGIPGSVLSRVPFTGKISHFLPSLQRILLKQVEQFRPDVLYVQDLNFCSPELYSELKKSARYLVGQIASPLPSPKTIASFDLILSSLPNFVAKFRDWGVNSEYLPLGFDSRVSLEVTEANRDIPVSFVGGISRYHGNTIPLLSEVASEAPGLEIYGYGSNFIDKVPSLNKLHKGEAWGLEMYKVLRRSRVTLNRHISISENYANNMRLYEATGMGALLITDKKSNLNEIFEIDREVLAYSSPTEAKELVRWAAENPAEARSIAEAGNRRTLGNYTYESVLAQLEGILSKLLSGKNRE